MGALPTELPSRALALHNHFLMQFNVGFVSCVLLSIRPLTSYSYKYSEVDQPFHICFKIVQMTKKNAYASTLNLARNYRKELISLLVSVVQATHVTEA